MAKELTEQTTQAAEEAKRQYLDIITEAETRAEQAQQDAAKALAAAQQLSTNAMEAAHASARSFVHKVLTDFSDEHEVHTLHQ